MTLELFLGGFVRLFFLLKSFETSSDSSLFLCADIAG